MLLFRLLTLPFAAALPGKAVAAPSSPPEWVALACMQQALTAFSFGLAHETDYIPVFSHLPTYASSGLAAGSCAARRHPSFWQELGFSASDSGSSKGVEGLHL